MRTPPNSSPDHSPLRGSSTPILGAMFFGVTGAWGQEALRTAIETDRSAEARRAPVTWPDERLQIGPVRFDVGVAFNTEWNSNVNLSPNNPQSDYILRPQANLRALWPITDAMRLNLGAGLGYTVYLQGTRNNRLLLTPDSELAFDMAIGDLVLTVYNRVDYSDDLAAESGLSNVQQDYARISNTAGLRAAYHLLDWRFQAGYAHYNYWSLTDAFSQLDRASHQVYARAGYALAAATEAGVESSASFTDYVEPIRSDFVSVSFGPYLNWRFTPDLQAQLRGGYVIYDFDDPPVGPGLGTLNSYYLGLNTRHTLTDSIAHQLGVSREVRVGTTSQYEEQFRVNYSIRWILLDPLSVSASLFYEHTLAPQTLFDERSHRAGFGAGANYRFTSRLSSGLGYRFVRRDSNLPARDYTQHSVNLNLAYRF